MEAALWKRFIGILLTFSPMHFLGFNVFYAVSWRIHCFLSFVFFFIQQQFLEMDIRSVISAADLFLFLETSAVNYFVSQELCWHFLNVTILESLELFLGLVNYSFFYSRNSISILLFFSFLFRSYCYFGGLIFNS